ncbi:hypothetical protein DRB06_01360 [Actinomyces sp. Z5]|uniref:Uncharacterized protein n=1 Tax=Actinomyces glycerinitolerans TaxID=1892869 RepID=A0A1M4S3L2_9ACTO|nr:MULTISPECIES: DUF6301 family protein [Actinomyces]RAX24250.1 hypothetical protein DRB06_01360 [Actinomyces sp. Z5]SHE26778.1 Hypothetical protein ACGLYG10_3033 [Actinomyces glycerinitolerans]
MTEIKILPVERAIEWIRAWAELDWPITWETACAVRDKLGWTPNPEDPELFTTELTVNQDGGYLIRLDGRCSEVSIPLCSRNPRAKRNTPWTTSLWRTYDAIADALTQLYGPGEQTGNRTDVLQTDWILNNQVTVCLVASNKSMSVGLDSPEITEIDQWES